MFLNSIMAIRVEEFSNGGYKIKKILPKNLHTQRKFLNFENWTNLKVALSQKLQDSFFIANFAIINIPFYYPKLLHPLHSIDKMSIFKNIYIPKKY